MSRSFIRGQNSIYNSEIATFRIRPILNLVKLPDGLGDFTRNSLLNKYQRLIDNT
jgi:hypothetical protein